MQDNMVVSIIPFGTTVLIRVVSTIQYVLLVVRLRQRNLGKQAVMWYCKNVINLQ